jgi:hypothetical protein
VPGQGLHAGEAQRDDILDRIQKVSKASGADLQPAEARHITLWAAKKALDTFLPDVKKLERFLETKCKEPIRSGLDKWAAHVVLIPRRYEFEHWLKASFEIIGEGLHAPRAVDIDATNMVLPHNAEAWTLVGLLAKQPAKFAELVGSLHEEQDALQAVQRIYGWDEKKLTEE